MTIHRAIETQAVRRPHARAVVCGDRALTYAQLDERANKLAHLLVGHGVGPDVIVGVHMDRSIDLVVAMLAILKAGGAYLPLDPNYPADRLAFMLADCQTRVVITDRDFAAFDGTCVDIRATAPIASAPGSAIDREVDATNLAYIIYTSGSTGTPKGVMIPHDRVTRLMTSTEAWFHFDENDVWTFFHSYAFDFSVWEIWGALIYGGTVVVVPDQVRRSPDELLALLAAEKVTVLNQVPSAFRHLISAARRASPPVPLALRYVIFGGEALELRSLVPWFERYPASPRLINMYGITETTVHVTYREIRPAECHEPAGSPIGVPIPDLEMYVLDRDLRPVADGQEGEIFVGGAGLARGYHRRPGLSAERFVPDPFSGRPGARLYKTGDVARRLADGSFEYLGRNDAQVKIRGHRIETGEIGSLLASYPGVREAVVVARDVGEDDRRLVAYVALDGDIAVEVLREHLASRLPAYMVPSAFVVVAALPVTPSGKIDHKALPAPDWAANADHAAYVAPQSDDERMMAALWASLIGVDRVGRDDRFFELGGHSLLAAQIASRLASDHGVSVPVRLFLTSPTVAEAAAAFADARMRQGGGQTRSAQLIPARTNVERAPLSYAQESIWVHEQVMQATAQRSRPYIECPVIQLRGKVAVPLLERALNEVAARHEIWRTGFSLADDPVQVIGRSARIPLKLVERRGVAPAERRDELVRAAEALATAPFALDRPPLVRAALVTFDDDDRALILVMHHMITDAWSEDLVAAELARLYGFLAAGDPLPPRTEVVTQYADYAEWERSEQREPERARARAFWTAHYQTVPEPLALPRTGAAAGRPVRTSRPLGAELSARVAAFCRHANVSPSATLYAAFSRYLARYTRDGRFVLGVANASRPAGTERIAGCFTSVTPLVVHLAGEPSFAELASQLMSGMSAAVSQTTLPLPEIARLVGRTRGPLVQVQASTQLPAAVHHAGGVELRQDYVQLNDAKFALEMIVQQAPDQSVTLTWVGDPAVFSAASLVSTAAGVERLLAEGIGAPAGPDVRDTGEEHSATLRTVLGLFAEVLEVPAVGPDDDFFERGGHDILVAHLVDRITEACGVELPLDDVLAAPTARSVASAVDRLRLQK